MNNPQQEQEQQHHQSKMQPNTANTNSITTALHSNNTSKPSLPSTATQNNSKESATSGGNVTTRLTQTPSKYNYNINQPKPLCVSIQSSQNIVNGKGASIITGTAYDAATGKKIENAIVKLKITFTSNGTSKEIVGHNGAISYSVEIKPNSKNSFRTTVQASAPGYISTSKTSASSSSSSNSTSNVTSNGNQQESIIDNSGP